MVEMLNFKMIQVSAGEAHPPLTTTGITAISDRLQNPSFSF